jgi:thymidylate synthase
VAYVLDVYDDALEAILKRGVRKQNRTGVDTLSIFGIHSRYRIDESFPILTRRKVWPRSIFCELIWMLSGSTNNNDLEKLGANIWKPWVDKEFEQKHGYVDGAFGPVYGFQLRHFGANYGDGSKTEGAGGFDQLSSMVERLKTNPDCRRNLFSLWNPNDVSKQKLPPCHVMFQVYVHEDKLSGMLTQRSCDWPIGIPANIQFYSALIYMLAQQTGLKPYEFIHSTADSHIYVNQIEAVEEYLGREKPDSPKLEVKKASDIFSYTPDSFLLSDYNPLPAIKIPVAV